MQGRTRLTREGVPEPRRTRRVVLLGRAGAGKIAAVIKASASSILRASVAITLSVALLECPHHAGAPVITGGPRNGDTPGGQAESRAQCRVCLWLSSKELIVRVVRGTLVAVMLISPALARAVPVGKQWSAPEVLGVSGHQLIAPDRFEPLRDGRLELVVRGMGGVLGIRGYGMLWSDSLWVQRWAFNSTYHVFWPTHTPLDRQMLLWNTQGQRVDDYYAYLATADVDPNGLIATPDTIAKVAFGAWVYSGTSWGRTRWAAVRDNDFSVLGFPEHLKIFRKQGDGPWKLMGDTGLTGRSGISIVALDSLCVLLLSSEFHGGIHWGYLRDTVFSEQALPLGSNPLSLWPRVTTDASGGVVAGWQEAPFDRLNDRVVIRRYREGHWSAPEDVSIRLPDPNQYFIDDVQLDAAGGAGPAIAWSGYSPNHVDAADFLWVSIPSDSGVGVGERLESTRGGVNPTIVRDEYGDVWLAWWRYLEAGCFWMHTYTSAVPSSPSVFETLGRPTISCALSEPAPESWWGILRGVGAGPMEQVATVRAGQASSIVWTDTTALPSGPLRFAVERLCRDKRYVLRTAEAEWLPPTSHLGLQLRSANPAAARVELELTGARSGLVRVRLLDLQGRQVAEVSSQANGSGRDVLTLVLPPQLRSGLYLIRVLGADGADSAPKKLVVLR